MPVLLSPRVRSFLKERLFPKVQLFRKVRLFLKVSDCKMLHQTSKMAMAVTSSSLLVPLKTLQDYHAARGQNVTVVDFGPSTVFNAPVTVAVPLSDETSQAAAAGAPVRALQLVGQASGNRSKSSMSILMPGLHLLKRTTFRNSQPPLSKLRQARSSRGAQPVFAMTRSRFSFRLRLRWKTLKPTLLRITIMRRWQLVRWWMCWSRDKPRAF